MMLWIRTFISAVKSYRMEPKPSLRKNGYYKTRRECWRACWGGAVLLWKIREGRMGKQ